MGVVKPSKKVGIYKITNLTNGKVYIGQSLDIDKRWETYKRGNFHGNRGLETDWKTHGYNNFKFEILLECKPEELDMYEYRYITEYNALEAGYNIMPPRDYARLNMELIKEYKHLILRTFSDNPDGKYWFADVADSFDLSEQELGIILDRVGCDLCEEHDVYLCVHKSSFSYDKAIIEKTTWAKHQEELKSAFEKLRL